MLHAALDLSRRCLDVCLIGDDGDVVGRLAAPPDADGLRRLVDHVRPQGRAGRDRVDDGRALRARHA
jgi:hypothetical protein